MTIITSLRVFKCINAIISQSFLKMITRHIIRSDEEGHDLAEYDTLINGLLRNFTTKAHEIYHMRVQY